MYQSEKTFVKKFIASLFASGVKEIPYDTPQFYAGVKSMEDFYNQNKSRLGKYSEEIGLLFMKNPIDGIYDGFKSGISSQNGLLMTFDNPGYVRARIVMKERDCDYIFNRGDIDISREFIDAFAARFCEGAGLP